MTLFKNMRVVWLMVALLGLMTLACQIGEVGSDGIPENALMIEVVANASLEPWLQTAVSNFNASDPTTSSGQPIYAIVQGVESGQQITNMADGSSQPALWIPDSPVWVNLAADQGITAYQNNCQSVAKSPLVIGMWRELAESLGWPGFPLGWLDVGSLAQDPTAYQYYSGGEYGDDLRLSHPHPGLSGAGAGTLLALVNAAQSSTSVSAADIQTPIVQASVGAFESAVSSFANSTSSLGDNMRERGASYLGAAVMYENDVVYGNGAMGSEGKIVPIYPLEGTFMATHPACINQEVDTETKEAAGLVRDYLLSDAGQETAVSFALRPVNKNTAIVSPLTEEFGVDLSQPEIIFNEPNVAALYAVQDLWQTARKDVNLVLLLDTSGSMRGGKMNNMRDAAAQFVAQMGDEDKLTIIAFSTEPDLLVEGIPVGTARQKLVNAINGLTANGDTTLFDAIGDGAASIERTTQSEMTNAMVVLSDGMDTRSYRYGFNNSLVEYATGNDTTIFTIAYGGDADEDVLSTL
ncbi:MAG: VWA domain-containing protein, partial [Anaerolineae bacterium]|nr:VWA domain-containing protein [Anaerolineae bacterium]